MKRSLMKRSLTSIVQNINRYKLISNNINVLTSSKNTILPLNRNIVTIRSSISNLLKISQSSKLSPKFSPIVFKSNEFSSVPSHSRIVLPTQSSPSTPSKGNLPTPEMGIPVSVRAHYIARGIDILRIHSQIYGSFKQVFHAKSVTITLNEANNEYISIFKYGSVVFFNVNETDSVEHLRRIKEASSISPIADGIQHTESYKIIIHSELENPSIIKATHTNITNLDSNNLAIIGTVMAQTVALDYYAVLADRLLETFVVMNEKIEGSGNFNSLDNKGLYKLVASNNAVITNVLSKLGIFEGSDAAWDDADYHYTWEALRKDFELDYRMKDLSLKLDIVKDNSRFFLEVLQHQKSTRLEWIIIILIGVEIVIGISGLAIQFV